ncbi:MAG: ATP-binding cassette domain-containing protein, partial [Gammaproteobacteria bacterium]|nr:ATP-binding cassette domain-containing protein [Gammaproteobacteria bacterium]
MDTAVASTSAGRAPGSSRDILPLTLRSVGLQRNGQDLLSDVCLTFDHGRVTVVLGPNGAGKTLLLKLCHGLLAPTSGSVAWARPELLRDPRAQSMVFQRPVILRRSVAANIDYALRVCGVPHSARSRRLQAALELAGLSDLATRAARVLSGGEQQRLALA